MQVLKLIQYNVKSVQQSTMTFTKRFPVTGSKVRAAFGATQTTCIIHSRIGQDKVDSWVVTMPINHLLT